jgi:hypothetical protein
MAREFGVDPFGQFGDGGVQVVQREEPLVAQSRIVPKARLRPRRAEGASSTATCRRRVFDRDVPKARLRPRRASVRRSEPRPRPLRTSLFLNQWRTMAHSLGLHGSEGTTAVSECAAMSA